MAGIEHRHWSATSDLSGLFFWISLICPSGKQLSETRTAGGLSVQAGALERKWEKLAS